MAYDKIIPLRARLDHCLDYVLNEEKSSLSYALTYAENPEKSRQLVTGVNCQARTAFQEMQATKRRWDKKGGILGYNARQLSQCLAALGGTLMLEVGQNGVLVMRTDDLVCLQLSRRKPTLLRAKEEKEQKKAVQAAA